MKNRKSFLSLCIVVLVLLLGVGYAVVNETELTIGGTASAKETEINVHFTGDVTETDEAPNGEIEEASHDGAITAVLNVSNLTLNESVSATYTIINSEQDLTAELAQDSITVLAQKADPETGEKKNLSSYFDVKLELGATELAPGASTTAKVTVTLAQSPVTADDSIADITVVIKATPAK